MENSPNQGSVIEVAGPSQEVKLRRYVDRKLAMWTFTARAFLVVGLATVLFGVILDLASGSGDTLVQYILGGLMLCTGRIIQAVCAVGKMIVLAPTDR